LLGYFLNIWRLEVHRKNDFLVVPHYTYSLSEENFCFTWSQT